MSAFTKGQLVEMWKRSPEKQINIAMSKILEAIRDTKGDICICFSGGKDSSLLLDMYCEALKMTSYASNPIKVAFADTTNETKNMYEFVDFFFEHIESKHQVKLDVQKIRPPKNLTWVKYVKENGIPIISKEQSKAIRCIINDMKKTGCDYETAIRLSKPEIQCVKELFDIGFSKTGVLSLTGYVSASGKFGNRYLLSKKWQPMLKCPVPITHLCCLHIKEASLNRITDSKRMTGEQAQESQYRENAYLQTGCNAKLKNGGYSSKPFGPMTSDGVLYGLKYRNVPICKDYGEILIDEDGHLKLSKCQRTGCALCGYGVQYDTERFIRLQESEPAKIKLAFKPFTDGGLGYLEAISFMNEYCGTKIILPR